MKTNYEQPRARLIAEMEYGQPFVYIATGYSNVFMKICMKKVIPILPRRDNAIHAVLNVRSGEIDFVIPSTFVYAVEASVFIHSKGKLQ